MRAGPRNVKVIIESRTEDSIDSVGDPVYTWATYSTQWAEILTESGKEFIEARAQHAELTHVLKMRYVAGVTPEMRINNGGSYYNILAAFDPSKRGRELKLYCNEPL